MCAESMECHTAGLLFHGSLPFDLLELPNEPNLFNASIRFLVNSADCIIIRVSEAMEEIEFSQKYVYYYVFLVF